MLKIARASLFFLALVAGWCLLSGKFDAMHLSIGIVGSLVITAVYFPRYEKRLFPLLRFLGFVPWHLGQVALSNLRVARMVLSPSSSRFEPEFIETDTGLTSNDGRTVLGCGITLMPGTLTVRVSGETMLVHALDRESAKDIRDGTMATKVRGVFRDERKP